MSAPHTAFLLKYKGKLRCLILLVVAFTLFSAGSWIARRSALLDGDFIFMARIVQSFTCIAIAMVFRRNRPPIRAFVIFSCLLFCVWATLYIVAFVLSFGATTTPSLAALCVLFEGIMSALVLLFFADSFSRFTEKEMAVGIAASFLLVELLFDASLYIPDTIIVAMRLAMQALGMISLLCLLKQNGWQKISFEQQKQKKTFQKSDTVFFIIEVFLLSAIFGFVRQLFSPAGTSEGLHDMTNGILQMGVEFLMVFFYASRGLKDSVLVAVASAALFSLGLTVLPLFYEVGSPFYGTVIKCAWGIFQPLIWILTVKLMQDNPNRSFLFSGLLIGLLHLGVVLGLVVSNSLVDGIADARIIAEVSLAFLLFLTLAAIAFFTYERLSRDRNSQLLKEPEHESSTFEKKLLAFKHSRRLTEREFEILLDATHGFSMRSIAQRKHIAEDTVHTHLRNVYAKAGVSNKQNLVELIDNLNPDA